MEMKNQRVQLILNTTARMVPVHRSCWGKRDHVCDVFWVNPAVVDMVRVKHQNYGLLGDSVKRHSHHVRGMCATQPV